MNEKYINVPISAAKRIAEEFQKDQVIIVCWDQVHGKTHVTTYGKTKIDCAQAAQGGNFVKRALGWPEELCHAKPARISQEEMDQAQGNPGIHKHTSIYRDPKHVPKPS